MPEAVVHVGGRDVPLTVRINGSDPTFRLASGAIRAAALAELDHRSLDLLEIAATIFAADSSITRGGPTRERMGEAWRRDFTFEIPVRVPELWSRPDVDEALRAVVEVATEDYVRFVFTRSNQEAEREPYFPLDEAQAAFRADEVVLFSGGLDSFAGALETLSSTADRIVLVSHRSAQKVIPRQKQLGEYLQKRFPGRVLHVQVKARRAGAEAADMTQRSRSLLFAALGKAVALSFGAERLSLYENGIVSHNLPVSQQIVGTMATRTTHPLVLTLLNRLLDLVWPDEQRLLNRYQWLTKTEVVGKLAQFGAADQIPKAVSCTSVRDQNKRHTHCGACTQCLDRRFAVLAARLDQRDRVEDYAVDVLFGPRDDTRSRTIALEWTRHSLRMETLDASGAMREFGQELSRIVSGHPELPSSETLRLILSMHQRHAAAVRSVLEGATVARAADLVTQSLPPSCLLVMHSGQAGGVPAPEPRFASLAAGWHPPDRTEDDVVPDPAAPLRVAFEQEGGLFIIAAQGLGEVRGEPAKVAHALKPAFDQDRAAGLPPAEHRFLHSRDLPFCGTLKKETFRQYVRRCRNELAEFFQAIHDRPPDRDLLIENRYGVGYRLDPATIVVASHLIR